MAASAFRAGRFAPLSREEAKPGKDTTTIDRQYPKCWVETLKMFLQVANNGTAVWEAIFSTWYPGKVSLLAAQRSRSNIQGSISPQTPSTATGAHKANDHRNSGFCHIVLNRQEEDRPRKCLLQGARHTVTWIKWVGQLFFFFLSVTNGPFIVLDHAISMSFYQFPNPLQFTQHHTLNP